MQNPRPQRDRNTFIEIAQAELLVVILPTGEHARRGTRSAFCWDDGGAVKRSEGVREEDRGKAPGERRPLYLNVLQL